MEDTVTKILEDAKNAKIEFIRLQFTDILGTPKNIVIPACSSE